MVRTTATFVGQEDYRDGDNTRRVAGDAHAVLDKAKCAVPRRRTKGPDPRVVGDPHVTGRSGGRVDTRRKRRRRSESIMVQSKGRHNPVEGK